MKINKLAVPALLLFGAAGCVDLDVTNPNQPDAAVALQTAGDVESLIAGSFQQYWNSEWSAGNGMGPILSVQSFQHSAFPANFGMILYSAPPIPPIVNEPAHQFYIQWSWPWTFNYRAISAARDGITAVQAGNVTFSAADERRALAFARFTQGLAHAQLAVLFDQAFIVDETTDLLATQEARPYGEVMAAALAFFDQAIALASQGGFEIPEGWMSQTITAAQLVPIIHSYKARYRAAVARTPAERQAVNWDAVIADADAGITADYAMQLRNVSPWGAFGSGYYVHQTGFNADGTLAGLWSQINYFILGMADQSGNYQQWLSYPLLDRHPRLGGGATDPPFIIVTPDNRFPSGATLAEQRTNQDGRYYWAATTTGMHGQPGRGTWRWSWYLNRRFADWMRDFAANPAYTWIPKAEMDLLRAEAHFNKGQLGAAADLINISRVAAGLNATDAAGTNTSCVPKLPNGDCGDLFEMLKWEKRNETLGQGLFAAPWYFDGRGWGDLYRGIQLEMPMPCREMQVLQLECYTFGGVGGARASAGSSYAWPGEM